jgi:two-component system NtrC family sensor kinase
LTTSNISSLGFIKEELPEDNRLFQSILDAFPYPLLIIDVNDFSVKIANSAAAPDGLSGTTTCYCLTRRLASPCNEADFSCPLENVRNTKKPAIVEQNYPDQSGRRRIAEVHCYPILDDNGNVNHIIESIIDITERRQPEEALRESEEKFRIIASSAHDSIIMMDNRGKATFCNKAAEKIFGYTEEEILGRDIHQLLAPKEYNNAFRQNFPRFRETGKGNAVGKTLELEAIRKGGHKFPIEISVSSIKLHGKWQAIGIIRDISERKQKEEKIAHLVNQYTAMIDTVPAIMYIKGIDHQYVEVNRAFCKFAGKRRNDIIGKTDYDLFPADGAERYHQSDMIVMDEDTAVSNREEKVIDPDGNPTWLTVTRVPIHDSQGLVAGVAGLIQDVTEHHLSREQLIQTDKLAAIGTLAAGVAHEINNPMGFINSNLNTMEKYLKRIRTYIDGIEGQNEDDRQRINEIATDFGDAIGESLEGANRVKKIVADLKSFSRVDRAQEEYANINEGLESTLNIVWNELKYKCKVEKDFGELPEIYCIPNQINQVFMNLLMNAGQAIKESGVISIKTWADEKNIYVSIKDTGFGISDENLKKVFEPFFTTKEVGKGTGLGLSLVYDIIRKHGGNIDVNSEVGVGTEFMVSLPLEGILEKQYA